MGDADRVRVKAPDAASRPKYGRTRTRCSSRRRRTRRIRNRALALGLAFGDGSPEAPRRLSCARGRARQSYRGEHRRRLCRHRRRQRCVPLSHRATQSESVTSERQRLASLALVGVRACDMSRSNRDVGLRKRQRHKMRVKFRALGDVEAGRAAETIRSQKSEIRISDLNILPMPARFVHMFANTRFVWVEINYIGPMNTLLERSAPSGIWYFPNKWYFSTGISIPIPSTVQIALCSRWYCYLVFVSGISKC